MKEEEGIKEGESNGKMDQKFVRETTAAAWTTFVTIFNQYILGQTSSDCAKDKFTLISLAHFCLIIF